VWLIGGGGMSASCKPRVQLFIDVGRGWLYSECTAHFLMKHLRISSLGECYI